MRRCSLLLGVFLLPLATSHAGIKGRNRPGPKGPKKPNHLQLVGGTDHRPPRTEGPSGSASFKRSAESTQVATKASLTTGERLGAAIRHLEHGDAFVLENPGEATAEGPAPLPWIRTTYNIPSSQDPNRTLADPIAHAIWTLSELSQQRENELVLLGIDLTPTGLYHAVALKRLQDHHGRRVLSFVRLYKHAPEATKQLGRSVEISRQTSSRFMLSGSVVSESQIVFPRSDREQYENSNPERVVELLAGRLRDFQRLTLQNKKSRSDFAERYRFALDDKGLLEALN